MVNLQGKTVKECNVNDAYISLNPSKDKCEELQNIVHKKETLIKQLQ